jgi:hypothetical protein
MPVTVQKELVKENFLESFLQYRPLLSEAHHDGTFNILFNFTEPGGLEFYRIKDDQSVWWIVAERK